MGGATSTPAEIYKARVSLNDSFTAAMKRDESHSRLIGWSFVARSSIRGFANRS